LPVEDHIFIKKKLKFSAEFEVEKLNRFNKIWAKLRRNVDKFKRYLGKSDYIWLTD